MNVNFCSFCLKFPPGSLQFCNLIKLLPTLSGTSDTHVIVFLLQEVIDLTKDLLTSQPTDSASSTNGSETVPLKLGWKVGDRCMAVWNQDGQ